jgi:hypothetical protein
MFPYSHFFLDHDLLGVSFIAKFEVNLIYHSSVTLEYERADTATSSHQIIPYIEQRLTLVSFP